MFEAVRSRLVAAWKDLHARGLPSLFLFELVVVTLGVLLAQAVAGWAARQSAFDDMETVKTELDSDIRSLPACLRPVAQLARPPDAPQALAQTTKAGP
jgi:hypothetical protein